ncbi:MAG: hypothetical protein BAJALOKI1v1_930008 [Promethearchaeota archaeon]|nr:MAG: hypothetical protein BAJALOKI1v1_930008 [Candidatus Lokiarchaeota archaeon]
MPNWIIHMKWALKAEIPERIAEFVNRSIDYGSNWLNTSNQQPQKDSKGSENEEDSEFDEEDTSGLHDEGEQESTFYRQLTFFYERDAAQKNYVKACFLHHLLDYFRETYVDLSNLELVFQKFIQDKAVIEIYDAQRNKINFMNVLSELFQLLRDNKSALYKDLRGE